MAGRGNESHGSIGQVGQAGQTGGHHHRHHHEGKRRYSINKFLQVGPKPLTGGENPEVARDWMARIVSAFRAFNCTEEQKMEVLEFVLEGRARLWWETKSAQARTERGQVTWEDFRQQFEKLYFPSVVRQARSMDLLMLRQGSMTIDQYQQRIDREKQVPEASSIHIDLGFSAPYLDLRPLAFVRIVSYLSRGGSPFEFSRWKFINFRGPAVRLPGILIHHPKEW